MVSLPDPGTSGLGGPLDDPVAPQAAEAALDRSQLQDRAVTGGLWTMVHVLVSVPVAFAANIAVARLLGTADYGRLAFLTALQGIAAGILGLGSGAALIQFGSKAFAAARHEEVRSLISRVQGLQLLFTLPLLTLVMVVAADLPMAMLVILVAFGVVLPTTLGVALDCLLIENRSAGSAQIALVTTVLSTVVAVGAAALVGTADAVWSVRLAVGGLSVVATLVLISAAHRRAVLRPRLPRGLPPGFWSFALLSMASAAVASLVMSRSEVFVLQWLGTPEAMGVFALAFGLTAHIFAPAQALVGPLIPALAALYEVETRETVRSAFLRTMRAASTVSGGAVAVLVAPVGLLVPALYGEQYAASAPLVVVLGALGATTMLTAPVSAFALARLSAGRLLRANLVALAVDLAAAVALIPPFGAWGAVVANVLGALTLFALVAPMEATRLHVGRARLAHVLVPTGAGGLAGTLGYLVGRAITPSLLAASAAAVLGASAYVVMVRLARAGLTSADADAITSALPARVRPAIRRGLGVLVCARTE